jgi:signal transduction histidine kinase
MMSLRNRMVLVYALFISGSVLGLGLIINHFAEHLFSAFVSDNIESESGNIVNAMQELYDPDIGGFDLMTLEAMGMYFVHKGYIVSVEDMEGGVVWDARSCDMQECASVINEIATRMEQDFRLDGAFQKNHYLLEYQGSGVGWVNIETYGPFFYSEGESGFLRTLNRFLLGAGIVFTLLSMVVSAVLSTALSRPILKAADAAKQIAGGKLSARIADRYAVRELHELSRSVNELADALEKGERWQKRMTADIAHELRTPLTCLQGNMEAMLDGVWEPTAERLASCYEEIKRLTNLVEDLGQLSILERESLILHRTRFDLAKLLSAAAERFLPAAREKGIAIRLDLAAAPLPLYADYDRLMQVFINLLSNAVKYTDQGSVTVRAAPEPPPADEAAAGAAPSPPGVPQYRVTLSDTGIGIPPEALPRIFDRFYRSDQSRSRGSGGAGIGLSIAAAIITAHGGRISAAANESAGKAAGSTFTVLL